MAIRMATRTSRDGLLEAVTVMLTREQRNWLRQEAVRRAMDREGGKPDASEIIREAVDKLMKRSSRRAE
jgi:hypothetical protein